MPPDLSVPRSPRAVDTVVRAGSAGSGRIPVRVGRGRSGCTESAA